MTAQERNDRMHIYAEQLKHLCSPGHVSIATAESVTAGGIANTIASVSGSSAYLAGGVVAYNLRQKVNLLGVDHDNAVGCDCVDARVAREMASGVQALFGTDVGVSITGYAGPYEADGITITEPYAWVGFSVGGYVWAEKVYAVAGDRVDVQQTYVTAVLSRLVLLLQGIATNVQMWPDGSQLSRRFELDGVQAKSVEALLDVARRVRPLP